MKYTWAGMMVGVVLAVSNMAMAGESAALSLREAHEMALRNHPLITLADLRALAAREVAREARAAFFPNLSANVVAVGTAENNTRLAGIGALNNPAIFDRNAEGLTVSQLLTDFGRTANLSGSARLRAEAEANSAQATREQILLAVDEAFYAALQAQSVTRVAQKTVAARQVFLEQVGALATNKLRSELDVSFARVNVEDAKLLLSRSQNDLEAAFARLSALMGERDSRTYRLAEQALPSAVSSNAAEFVQQALRSRPDLLSLRDQHAASLRFAKGERALRYPTISAVGSAGVVPLHDQPLQDTFAAAGLVLNMPVFAGGYYAARQQEAELRAEAEAARLRDLENSVVRDVRVAWLNTQNAYDRYRITGQLLENARQSYSLAEARYRNGISSIVEFNQAELSLISAEISLANTQYEYLVRRSALSFQTGSLQ